MRRIEESPNSGKTRVWIVVANSQVRLMKTCLFKGHEGLTLEGKILYHSIYLSFIEERFCLHADLIQTWRRMSCNLLNILVLQGSITAFLHRKQWILPDNPESELSKKSTKNWWNSYFKNLLISDKISLRFVILQTTLPRAIICGFI